MVVCTVALTHEFMQWVLILISESDNKVTIHGEKYK